MISIRCKKCGDVLNTNHPAYKGLPIKESVKKLASDHASKRGCDWPAANLDVAIKMMNK